MTTINHATSQRRGQPGNPGKFASSTSGATVPPAALVPPSRLDPFAIDGTESSYDRAWERLKAVNTQVSAARTGTIRQRVALLRSPDLTLQAALALSDDPRVRIRRRAIRRLVGFAEGNASTTLQVTYRLSDMAGDDTSRLVRCDAEEALARLA